MIETLEELIVKDSAVILDTNMLTPPDFDSTFFFRKNGRKPLDLDGAYYIVIERLAVLEWLLKNRNLIATKEVCEEIGLHIERIKKYISTPDLTERKADFLSEYVKQLGLVKNDLLNRDPREKGSLFSELPFVDMEEELYKKTLSKIKPISEKLHERDWRGHKSIARRTMTDIGLVAIGYVLNKKYEFPVFILTADKGVLKLARNVEEGTEYSHDRQDRHIKLVYSLSGYSMTLISVDKVLS